MKRYLFVLMLLAGCSTRSWQHPTKNQQQFYQDSVHCQQIAAGTRVGAALVDDLARSSITSDCLKANGWMYAATPDGNACLERAARVNQRVYLSDQGRYGIVRQIHGSAERCQDARIPMFATVEYE